MHGVSIETGTKETFNRSLTQMDRVPVFETGGRGFESCRAGQLKEILMKSITLKNKLNGEQFICDNTKDVEVIDGIEYLMVRRFGTDRRVLMKKDALEKVNSNTVKPKSISK